MLRPSYLNYIRRCLDTTNFSAVDFEVSSSSQTSEPVLSIKFLHDGRFTFSAFESGDGFELIMSPGEMRMTEFDRVSDISSIDVYIFDWAGRVYEEVKQFNPLTKDFEAFKVKLEEYVEATIDDSLERFTSSEISKMSDKMADLEQRLAKMEADAEITKQQYDKAISDIDKIFSSMQDLPKSLWYKTAGNKFWFLLQSFVTSKEGQKTISSAVQKAIGIDGP